MRKCPDLHFIADDSIEYSTKINEIIKDIDLGEDETTEDDTEV